MLLIGWEHPREINLTANKKKLIHTLQLTGLNIAATQELLKDYGLIENTHQQTLINHYQGNPLWLKSVVTMRQEMGEDTINSLPKDAILLPEELKDSLHQ